MESNGMKWLVLTVGILTIVTITIFNLNQTEKNYQRNLAKIEECENSTAETVKNNTGVLPGSLSVLCEE